MLPTEDAERLVLCHGHERFIVSEGVTVDAGAKVAEAEPPAKKGKKTR